MSNESIPIKDVLADENHSAHAAVKTMFDKVDSGELSFCGCIGPMYGEPYCACEMKRRGLPLNEEARAVEEKRFEESMQALFGPGGEYHKSEEK